MHATAFVFHMAEGIHVYGWIVKENSLALYMEHPFLDSTIVLI